MVNADRIAGGARELAGRAQSAVGNLTGSDHDTVKARINEAQGSAENLYGQAKDALRHAADEVSDHARDAYDQGRHYTWEGHQRSVEWPHASLLVAGLVGFGIGLLVSKL